VLSNFFQIACLIVCLILMKLGTHYLCANKQKTVELIFETDFKFFSKFFESLHLDLVSAAAAVELSTLTGLTSLLFDIEECRD